jgi:uncharacterized protein (TIGR03437 family)
MVQDSAGNTYFTDGAVVRKIGADGTIATILGFPGATQDQGPASTISLKSPEALAVDAKGNLYVSDAGAVRMMTPDGMVTRIAGNNSSTQSPLASGDARNATLFYPSGLALDPSGNLIVADTFNNRILKVTPAGQFSTIGGTFGKAGYSGDGGAAAQALLFTPRSLSVDAWGNIYFIESGSRYIRKISATGIISTIAGNGSNGLAPDGGRGTDGPIAVQFIGASLLADPAGNISFTQPTVQRLTQLTPNKLQPAGVQHAALLTSGPVTSNLLVNIQGTELIPPGAGSSALGVLFDGQPGTVVSVSSSQILAVVPALSAGQTTTNLQVAINGALTNSATLNVVPAIPGVVSILNADGSTNSASAPASPGDVVTIQLTGDGNPDPSTVAVTIGGNAANVVSFGPSSTMPGVDQIVVQLPDGTSDGSPVVVMVGSASSQSGVTISLQDAAGSNQPRITPRWTGRRAKISP